MSAQYVALCVSTQYVALCVSAQYVALCVSAQYVALCVSAQYVALCVSAQYVALCVSAQYVALCVSAQYVALCVSAQYVALCVSAQYVDCLFQERMWRKNRRYAGRGCYGVDLNRNWDYKWGGEKMWTQYIAVCAWYIVCLENSFKGELHYVLPTCFPTENGSFK